MNWNGIGIGLLVGYFVGFLFFLCVWDRLEYLMDAESTLLRVIRRIRK